MATQAQIAAVQQLYVGYLGRAADQAGLNFWADAIANGTATIKSVATGFTLSTEYKAAYAGLTSDALVDQVYNNVLGRSADTEGKAFWVAALAKGTVTADTLVATIVTNLGALDQATINNKVFVAQTYTDTVGAEYNPTAGASVLVGVDSTPASVTTALGNIAGGTLAGLVPGLNLINAQTAAVTAVADYAKAVAAANPTFDTGTTPDGLVSHQEVTDAIIALQSARTLDADGATTLTLIGNAAAAKAVLEAAKTVVTATTAGAAATTAFDTALAAKVSDADVAANVAATASAEAGLSSSFAPTNTLWAALDAKYLNDGDITSAASLYSALIDTSITATARGLLVSEVTAKAGSYGVSLVAAADKALAIDKADAAIETAAGALATATSLTAAENYIQAEIDNKTAADTLTKVQADDAKIVAAQAIDVKYTALDKAVVDAGTAIANFDATKAVITNVSGDNAATGTAVSDVFYFASKVTGANDFTIGSNVPNSHFGAGDSIVLDSSLTYNSGALSTGNNNASEFFLIQGKTGVQVVIETTAVGSTNATTAADGAVTTTVGATDTTAVITLTGVTLDHVAVNHGVVSYV